jgi:hypothetical protein
MVPEPNDYPFYIFGVLRSSVISLSSLLPVLHAMIAQYQYSDTLEDAVYAMLTVNCS